MKNYKCEICWEELVVSDVFTFEGIHEHDLCISCAKKLERKLVELRKEVNPI